MNIRTLIFLLLITYKTSPGQEFAPNGLGPFEIGTPYIELQQNLEEYLSISYGQKYYYYTGKNLDVWEGLKIHKISLGFFQGKLNYIDFYFRKPEENTFLFLLSKCETLLGKAAKIEKASEKGVFRAYSWTHDLNYFQLISYNNEAIDWDDRNMTILMVQYKGAGN